MITHAINGKAGISHGYLEARSNTQKLQGDKPI